MRQTIQSLIFLIFCNVVYSQDQGSAKGNKEFDAYSFVNAREYYLRVAQKKDPSPELLGKLGDSYYYNADYVKASHWYKTLFAKTDDVDPDYRYKYAMSLKSTGDYQKSDSLMDKFYQLKGQNRLTVLSSKREYLKEIELQSGRFSIEKAGFNDENSDFAPSFYGDTLVFSSNRLHRQSSKNIHSWNNQPFLDLYRLDPNKKEKTTFFSKEINSKYHESTSVFTKDGKTIYFTRNNYLDKNLGKDSEGLSRLKLYRGQKNGEKWDVEELPFDSDNYSVAHPALSFDEQTLYFSSDMPGGYGNSDIYKVKILKDGFGTPENLGEGINTNGRETFPFVANDNKLFFSSDGHQGLGGLDVFVIAQDVNGKFDTVFNAGKPINSPFDDFTFIVNNQGDGYVASNREDSANDEIYITKQLKPLITHCNQFLKGVVLDDKTKTSISDAKISLMTDNNQILAVVSSDMQGKYAFDIPLDCNKVYLVRAEKPLYTTKEAMITTGNIPENVIEQTLLLVRGDFVTGTDLGQVLHLDPIYFNLDKWDIRKDAEIELKKVIDAMSKFPNLKIDVRSHTDSRALSKYNMDLSNKRNKATINYIIKVGKIDSGRLSGRGYGESEPVNQCTDGVKCTEKEHQLNRRSEFIILRK